MEHVIQSKLKKFGTGVRAQDKNLYSKIKWKKGREFEAFNLRRGLVFKII